MRTKLLLLAAPLALSACSSAPKARIVETESGVLQAVGTAKEEPDARVSAIDQAQDYCGDRKERAIFQDRELRGEPDDSRKETALLGRLPFIGQVLKGGEKTQVLLRFRCAKGPSAP
jgi:hypothetical protein